MPRVLIVIPPFIAHTLPLVSIARELERRGCEIAWLSHQKVAGFIPPEHRTFVSSFPYTDDDEKALREATSGFTLNSAKNLYEMVIFPLLKSDLPTTMAAIQAFQPDIVITDQHAFAGSFAARKAGLPWVVSLPTADILDESLPNVPQFGAWHDNLLEEFQREAGLEMKPNPQLSDRLNIFYSTSRLFGRLDTVVNSCLAVGPLIEDRVEDTDFPWELTSGAPLVYVTLGTISYFRGEKFLTSVCEALGGRELQVVVSDPGGLLPTAPPNFIVRPWIPQLAVMSRATAVICHAGNITVGDALWHGLPLVVTPIAYDNANVAKNVVRSGAGIQVRLRGSSSAEIWAATEAILTDSSYRKNAQEIAESFRRAGGAKAAATAILDVLA